MRLRFSCKRHPPNGSPRQSRVHDIIRRLSEIRLLVCIHPGIQYVLSSILGVVTHTGLAVIVLLTIMRAFQICALRFRWILLPWFQQLTTHPKGIRIHPGPAGYIDRVSISHLLGELTNLLRNVGLQQLCTAYA